MFQLTLPAFLLEGAFLAGPLSFLTGLLLEETLILILFSS